MKRVLTPLFFLPGLRHSYSQTRCLLSRHSIGGCDELQLSISLFQSVKNFDLVNHRNHVSIACTSNESHTAGHVETHGTVLDLNWRLFCHAHLSHLSHLSSFTKLFSDSKLLLSVVAMLYKCRSPFSFRSSRLSTMSRMPHSRRSRVTSNSHNDFQIPMIILAVSVLWGFPRYKKLLSTHPVFAFLNCTPTRV